MRTLDVSRQSGKFIKALPPKLCKQVIVKLLELIQNPTPNDCAKLKGYDDFYRVDIGKYRIVYQFNPDTLSVLLIDQRNDDAVYKALKQL